MPQNLPEFIWWLLLTVLGVAGVLAVFVLKKIDKNQTDLYIKSNNHETRLSSLEGAHNALHGSGKVG